MADLALRDITDALNNRLIAAAIVPADQIQWSNRTFVPKKGTSYLGAEMAGRNRAPQGFGADGVQMWNGIYQVSVFVPRDSGDREQAIMANKVLAAFPRGLNLSLSGGKPLIIEYSSAPPPVVSNDWSLQPVLISWFATEP